MSIEHAPWTNNCWLYKCWQQFLSSTFVFSKHPTLLLYQRQNQSREYQQVFAFSFYCFCFRGICVSIVLSILRSELFFFSFSKIHWRTKKRILWMLEKWNLWQFSMVFIKQSLTNKSAECIAEIHKRFRMLLHHRNRLHKIICRKKLFDFLPKLKYFAISLYKILFQSWLQILITLK